MATIPSTEQLLLEVHQCLGLSAPTKKKELIGFERPLETHQRIISELISEIFTALNIDEQAKNDASINLCHLLGINNSIERSVWTHEASMQQIVWNMAAYLYAPYLGRTVAFWSLCQTMDEGMPGGKFWYLPNVIERNDKKELRLPVPQVLDWLLDLSGQTISELAQRLAGKINAAGKSISVGVELESIEKILSNWDKGDMPRVGNINLYFSNIAALDFRGAFKLDTASTKEEQFQSTLQFIKRKNLSASLLREQIPMSQPNRIENILNGVADEDEKHDFVELIATRYAVPTPQTIHQRFLVARAVQDGYFRLGKFLLESDFDKTCADFSKNKVLQLFELFKLSYNLTVDAHKQSSDWQIQDAYFESKIPPWDKLGVFLSVVPSLRPDVINILADRLNHLFPNEYQGKPLVDHIGHDIESAKLIVTRNLVTLKAEQQESNIVKECSQKLRTHSPWRTLQNVHSFWVANELAQDDQHSFKIRQMAANRMRELAQTPSEKMGAIFIELSHLLNNDDRKYRDKDAKKKVESLLIEAKENPALNAWLAGILQYEAKHHLAFNDFDNARRLFKDALEACKDNGFGSLRGEIARDGFALVVEQPPTKFDLNNYEYYFRNVLAYGELEGEEENKTFEDTACAMSTYFWETLYRPYPSETSVAPLSKELGETFIKGAMPFVFEGNFDGLLNWFKNNSKLKDKKFREVRGNTALMSWLKMFYELEKKLPALDHFLSADKTPEDTKLAVNWRKAICLMIGAWPKLVNMPDFKLQTPAILAANHGDIVVVNALLKENANLRQQDFKGRTALHAAIASNSLECVEAILNHDAEVANIYADKNQSALHTAVKFGQPKIVETLISCAPHLHSHTDTYGKSALEIATYFAIPSNWQEHHKFMSRERRTIATLDDFQKVSSFLSTH
ncbi:ankyrin repeat domain-containing protein [Undibacterium macrobrachii]|uniref:Ankyrin repeat domain-containing protein n=1 Tax=Undibacterium macrobrachii TaxID=1119058 RepID=A0ABQ2XE93_9BURK|nr:ankyrin repeat domain-containing protein [Undibacterium macrobrachii]GGX13172.1 hypothetical protein GCM10011282_19130 [Undibacterium macrobrachii]